MSSVAVDKLSPAEKSQLACTYAALILHDQKIDIKADKLTKLINAAGVNVEPFWPKLIAKALEGRNVSDFFGGSAAPAATTAAEPVKEAAKVEKKEAPKEAPKDAKKKKEEPKPPVEDEDDGGMGDLFG